jgi:hypothetical protein
MKNLILIAAASLLMASCASTPTVNTDSDPSANFSSYRTYTWLSKPEGISPLATQRIVDSVNAQLQAKGWSETVNGDVAIAAHVASSQKQTLDTMYSGPMYGGWGYRGGWYGGGMGMSSTTVRTYTVGTLIVDMFDSKTKQAVWRGTASDTVPSSPEKANALIQSAVTGMFKDFPPGSTPAK